MKKFLALALTLAMLLVLAAGCANQPPTEDSESTGEPSAAPSESTPQTRVLLDAEGRERGSGHSRAHRLRGRGCTAL